MTFALDRLNSRALWSSLLSASVWPWLLAAMVLLAAFAVAERLSAAPVVDLRLLRQRQISIANGLSFTAGMAEAGLVFVPYYAVSVLGASTGQSGTLVLAAAVTMFFCTEPVGRLLDVAGARPVLAAGSLITALGAAGMVFARSTALAAAALVVLGLGLSALLGAPVRYIAINASPPDQRAVAQGLLSVFSTLGIMLGSTLAGALLASNPGSARGFQGIYLLVSAAAGVSFVLALALKPAR